MRNIKYCLCLILFAACNKPSPPNNEIIKIEFARSGAWFDRGAAISIDSSLTYNYYGIIDTNYNVNKKNRFYTGKITQAYWDTINQKIGSIKYKTTDTSDHRLVFDANEYEIIITWKNGKRHLVRTDVGKGDTVLSILGWINDSFEHVKLHPIKTPVKFETTYQNGPPSPKTEDVKFPPPNKN